MICPLDVPMLLIAAEPLASDIKVNVPALSTVVPYAVPKLITEVEPKIKIFELYILELLPVPPPAFKFIVQGEPLGDPAIKVPLFVISPPYPFMFMIEPELTVNLPALLKPEVPAPKVKVV